MKKNLLTLFLIVTLVAACLFGCGRGDPLAGTWVTSDGYDGNLLFDEYPASLILRADGSGTVDGMSIAWTKSGATLQLAGFWGTEDFQFQQKGDTLTLYAYGSNGWCVHYSRIAR